MSDSTIARYAELDPDVRLMLAVRDGDSSAFEQLVVRYQGRLSDCAAPLVGRFWSS